MSEGFRHITRIADTDVDGTLKVARAISKIGGVGICLATSIVRRGGIDPEARIGFLSEQDTAKLESIVKDPAKFGLPSWLFNRQKDLDTGRSLHLTGSDLVLQAKTDIDLLKATKSWKGYRHSYGLKARGQRTRTTGRKGKAIGVRKKRRPERQG